MFPFKRVSVFFVLTMLIYGLLFLPWITPRPAYRSLLVGAGNLILPHAFGDRGSVTLEAITETPKGQDVAVRLVKHRPQRVTATMELSSGHLGFRASAFLIALVLATPIAFPRRAWALLWGILLINAFVLLRLWLKLMDGFSDSNVLAIFTFGETLKSELQWAVLMLYKAPEMNYIIPALVWLLVTFRRGDLPAILGWQEKGKTSGHRGGKAPSKPD